MRSILIGRKHGSEKWFMIGAPEIAHEDKIMEWQRLVREHPINDQLAEIQLHRCDDTTEIFSRKKFVTTEQAQANSKAAAEMDASALQSNEDGAKRQATAQRDTIEKELAERKKVVDRLNKLHDAHREAFCGKSPEVMKKNLDLLQQSEIEKKAKEEREAEEARKQAETERLAKRRGK